MPHNPIVSRVDVDLPEIMDRVALVVDVRVRKARRVRFGLWLIQIGARVAGVKYREDE